MGYPDLLHLMKSPHWLIWILSETVLIVGAILISRLVPGVPYLVPGLLLLLAALLFSVLSFGIAIIPDFRKILVRPEALFETRHYVFLILGGLLGLLWALSIIAGIVQNAASIA